MDRNKTVVITDKNFKIFVANVSDDTDINFWVNLDKIKKQNYHLGILLNQKNISAFNDLSMPLFFTDSILHYYVLDVIHSPPKSCEKTYRFIFVDICSLLDEIFCEDGRDNKCVEMSIFHKNAVFHDWLMDTLDEGRKMDKMFFVTDSTPFLYMAAMPDNICINDLLSILIKYSGTSLLYLSTDNDYYQHILLYDSSFFSSDEDKFKNQTNINLFAIGTLGTPRKMPCLFIRSVYDHFYGKIGYLVPNRFLENIGGYLEIMASEKEKRISFVTPTKDDVIKYVVHRIIRLIQKSRDSFLSSDELTILESYKTTIVSENYLSYYKTITYSKNSSTNLRKWIFLDKILPEIDKIMENDLYSH